MRVLVQRILAAMPGICNVFAFLVFVLAVFGLFANSLFAGNLPHTCHVYDGEAEAVSTGVTCDSKCSWNSRMLIGCDSLGPNTQQLESYADVALVVQLPQGAAVPPPQPGSSARAATGRQPELRRDVLRLDAARDRLLPGDHARGWVDQMYDLMDGMSVSSSSTT